MAARPATRHIRERATPDLQARAPIRDLTRGSASFRIAWDVRPAYDFVFSLSDDAGSSDDLPAADRTWLAESKASMPADVAATTRLFESEICIHAGVMIVDRPAVRTADEFVAPSRAASRTTSSGRCSRRARGSQSSQRSSIARSRATRRCCLPSRSSCPTATSRSAWRSSGIQTKRSATSSACSPPGPSNSRRSSHGSRRSSSATTSPRAADRASLWPGRSDRADDERHPLAARGRDQAGDPRPSYFSRPYNFLMSASDFRLFGYPVSDEALEEVDPLAAPQSVVRLHRALATRPAEDPEAAGRARPVPDRDRPAARALEADDQAPPGPTPFRRARHDH